jgi:DNA-binding IclR family transcriptional regulator
MRHSLKKPRQAAEAGRSEKPLERYLRVIEIVAAFPLGVGMTEIMEIIDLPKTTVHRLLGGLVETGALTQSQHRASAYTMGARLLRALYVGTPDEWIEPLTRPVLSDLADRTGLSAFIAKLGDKEVRSVAIVAPENAAARGYVVPGRQLWPHAGSSAKAILAFQPQEVVNAILPSPLPRLTDRTITDLKALLKQFKEIRRTGLATCVDEDFAGFGGLACPIHVEKVGVIYSVAVTATTEVLFSKNQDHYVAELRRCARRLGHAIGTRLTQVPVDNNFHT